MYEDLFTRKRGLTQNGGGNTKRYEYEAKGWIALKEEGHE